LDHPTALAELASGLGIASRVRFLPPLARPALADLYRASDLVAVPSYSESFGLVALEAQACGTPVVAAAVGGLVTAVRDRVSGVLVDSHDPADWARVLAALLAAPAWRSELAAGAVAHARRFSWDLTTNRLLAVYRGAVAENRARLAAQLVGS
jgi:D-inositol-3-phosphate glycosyltransferase